MGVADFEEKEFEQPLNAQLASDGRIWSPGQILEHVVGFDAAMVTEHASFWGRMGFKAPPSGAVISPIWWDWKARLALKFTRTPPPYHRNLFLQHKRPEYLTTPSSAEWGSWNENYYRFAITSHQQLALEACAMALGQDGIVAYASPVSHSRQALFAHIENQTLVDNTHFAPAHSLKGHKRYTYKDATSPGLAHSEPASVTPIRLFYSNNELQDPALDGPGKSPSDFLKDAGRAAKAAIAASPDIVGTETVFKNAVIRAEEWVRFFGFDGVDPISDFILADLFSRMAGFRWMALSIANGLETDNVEQ